MNFPLRHGAAGLALLAFAFLTGCATKPTGLPKPLPDRQERMKHGYLYYLDGAGGGTARKNWSAGVVRGILDGGYQGAGEMFTWETGKGLIADQDASVEDKRSKAKIMAAKLAKQARAFPDAPVHILGFSAGTAVAVFALEELPSDVQVENVVLLGASISDKYDMTEALERVRGKLFLFTSKRDRMLSFLMGFSGTADRKFEPGAGETGFILPEKAGAATKKLYAEKIVTIPWTKAMTSDGNDGRHFDNVKPSFIRDYVVPLIRTARAN
jgi:pimeloyl-ACP methyl ester carboxylesterase